MVGAGLGLATRGKIPFVSTFAAFFSRAFDQIRMSQYSEPNLKFCGSHAGVSIGEDGPSQMGLEDLAMFRAILDSVVLYPADAVSTERLVEAARNTTASSISAPPAWPLPSSTAPRRNFPSAAARCCARATRTWPRSSAPASPCLKPWRPTTHLQQEGIAIRVIDLYSVKPVDAATLLTAARPPKASSPWKTTIPQAASARRSWRPWPPTRCRLYSLAVTQKPKTGKPAELLDFEEISRSAIVKLVKQIKQGQ